MKAFGLVVVAAASAALGQQASGASTACTAAPVKMIRVPGQPSPLGPVVRAGPFVGYIALDYDVIGGRFRLHVGPYRDKASGLTQKIPWYVLPRDIPGAKLGDRLVITAKRLSPRPARYFRESYSGGGLFPLGYVFPTNITPPSAGCWRLTFRSGGVSGTLTALVRD